VSRCRCHDELGEHVPPKKSQLTTSVIDYGLVRIRQRRQIIGFDFESATYGDRIYRMAAEEFFSTCRKLSAIGSSNDETAPTNHHPHLPFHFTGGAALWYRCRW